MSLNLTAQEIHVLKSLQNGREHLFDDLVEQLGLDQVAVSRASLTLQQNDLVQMREETNLYAEITKEGEQVLNEGLPERQLIFELKHGPKTIAQVTLPTKGIALGWAKKKGYIDVKDGTLHLTKEGIASLDKRDVEVTLLTKLKDNQILNREEIELLGSRKLVNYYLKPRRFLKITPQGLSIAEKAKVVEEISQLTPELIKSGKWREMQLRQYNVAAPAKPLYYGKRHFRHQVADYIRKIWLEMGFKEMEGNLVSTAFWNFDALFTPQDHPAREMQDTFFIDGKGKLPEQTLVDKVKQAHETGTKGSTGWEYKWSPEIARQLVLRTHTTVLSAQTIARLKASQLPAKYFAVNSVFRNEALDWKHLFEFTQVEGIVIDENANFRHLLGYLRAFYKKMGYTDVRIQPSYFPYTEMSCEVHVFNPIKNQWVELGGAGIFRPEVVEPLLGKDVPVLAWGQGMERIIPAYYGLSDIRDIYRNDLKQLREMKQWMLG